MVGRPDQINFKVRLANYVTMIGLFSEYLVRFGVETEEAPTGGWGRMAGVAEWVESVSL